MTKKRALVTGCAGQDGSYLSELLLEAGYDVYGIVRYSTTENIYPNLENVIDDIELIEGDVTDFAFMKKTIDSIKPHEIYNLAAQSHVGKSFEMPMYTTNATATSVLNLLEIIKDSTFRSKLYQASTSELYGNNANDKVQTEMSRFDPCSPYAISKLYAHQMVKTYREAYNIFACCGILFNHESPRRGENFVTQKVCKAAAEISLGKRDKLELGNLTSQRDWGHAKDYVEGMYKMMNHHTPDDFVLATGKMYSIKQLVDVAFKLVDLDPANHVVINSAFKRPAELHALVGSSDKAAYTLGWTPQITFEEMIEEMVESQIKKIKEKQ